MIMPYPKLQDRELQKSFDDLPRTKIHPVCGHYILDPQMCGCYSCDNIDCRNCASFTVLHIYMEDKLRQIDSLFPDITETERDILFWD